jgi:BlaI family transcriptional regulator, penicillinase repressor
MCRPATPTRIEYGKPRKNLPGSYYHSKLAHVRSREQMAEPRLTKLELQIMEVLWTHSKASIREIQESFPDRNRPAYTTIQTTVYRLEEKKAVRRVKKVANFHIFEALVSRDAAQRKLIDDLLTLFGGRTQPVMARLIESGKLTLEDVREAEKTLRKLGRQETSK